MKPWAKLAIGFGIAIAIGTVGAMFHDAQVLENTVSKDCWDRGGTLIHADHFYCIKRDAFVVVP